MNKVLKITIKSIRKIIIYAIYIFIALYLYILAPILGGYNPLVVESGSMTPTYNMYDVIYFKPIAKSQLKENDVIVFEVKSDKEEIPAYVMHRITRIEGDKFYTKGDYNNTEDTSSVSYDKIQGKVSEYKIPKIGKYILYCLNNVWTIIVPIIICLLDFLIPNIYQIYKEQKNKKSRNAQDTIVKSE